MRNFVFKIWTMMSPVFGHSLYVQYYVLYFFFFNFSASERCFDSPTPSSLHHSYETLNTLYDTSSMGNDTNGDTCSLGGNGSQKLPHRPAPPVPSAKTNGSNYPAQNMSSHSGDDIQKFDSISNKKKSR